MCEAVAAKQLVCSIACCHHLYSMHCNQAVALSFLTRSQWQRPVGLLAPLCNSQNFLIMAYRNMTALAAMSPSPPTCTPNSEALRSAHEMAMSLRNVMGSKLLSTRTQCASSCCTNSSKVMWMTWCVRPAAAADAVACGRSVGSEGHSKVHKHVWQGISY